MREKLYLSSYSSSIGNWTFLWGNKFARRQEEETESDVNQSKSSVQLIYFPSSYFFISSPAISMTNFIRYTKARRLFQLMNTWVLNRSRNNWRRFQESPNPQDLWMKSLANKMIVILLFVYDIRKLFNYTFHIVSFHQNISLIFHECFNNFKILLTKSNPKCNF